MMSQAPTACGRHRWPLPSTPERQDNTPTQRTRAHSLREQISPPVPARPRGHGAAQRDTWAAEQASPPLGPPAHPPRRRPQRKAGAAAPELGPRDLERVRPQGPVQLNNEETEWAAAPRPHLPSEDLDALQGALGRHDCSYKRE